MLPEPPRRVSFDGEGRVSDTPEQRAKQVRQRQDKFLAAYAAYCTIQGACRALKTNRKGAYYVSRETVRLWRRDDPAFEQRFQDIKPELEATLAESAYDDALGEWNEKTQRFTAGNAILKIFLLKALNPEKYRDQMKLEHSGGIKTSPELAALAGMSKAELLKLAEIKD